MTARVLVAIAATLSLGACATNDIHAGKSAGRLAASSLVTAEGGTQVRVVVDPTPVGLPPVAVADYMDHQEAKFRLGLAGTGVEVERIGQQILLRLPSNITFNSNSADIRSDFFEVLNEVSKVLSEYSSTTIEISGHTDSTGGDKINQPLSERRADSVAMYLRSQKVSRDRITSTGYGSKYPLASNDTTTGRDRNRRIEILITPVLPSPEPAPLSGSSVEEPDQDADEASGQGQATERPWRKGRSPRHQ